MRAFSVSPGSSEAPKALQQKIQKKFSEIDVLQRKCKRLIGKYHEFSEKLRSSMAHRVRSKAKLSPKDIFSFQQQYAAYQEEREGLLLLLAELDRILHDGILWAELAPSDGECDYESVHQELCDMEEYLHSALERLQMAVKSVRELLDIIHGSSN
jgi:chaperonin cofactor prefoldin